MKKIILFLCLSIWSVNVFSQLDGIDLIVKSNYSHVNIKDDLRPTKGNFGLEVGAEIKYLYRDKLTFISGGSIQYLNWKLVQEQEIHLLTMGQHLLYFKIPIYVEYPLSDEWSLTGGVWGSFLINANYREQRYLNINDRTFFTKVPFGASLGINYRLSNNMIFTGDYSYGINTLYSDQRPADGTLHLFSLGIKCPIKTKQ